MGIYVKDDGFVKRSLQQILTSFNTQLIALFGPAVDVSPEGPTGQQVGLQAAGLADNWDALQEIYNSLDPAYATGAALDRVCAYNNIQRIAAAETAVDGVLYTDSANSGVTIPAGSQARRVRGAVVFSLTAPVVIAPGSCRDIYLKFAAGPVGGTTYTVTTSFGAFSYTCPSGSDPAAMAFQTLVGIAGKINTPSGGSNPSQDAWLQKGGVAQVWVGGSLGTPLVDTIGGAQVTSGPVIRIVNPNLSFGVTVSSTWDLQAVGSVGKFICNDVGAQTVNPNELTSIVTPQTGWIGVTNLALAAVGRDMETDEQLRIRRKKSLGQGYSTEAAMAAYLLNNLPHITAVTVTSNRGDSEDSYHNPPHSVTVTYMGSDTNDEVAAAIWACAPAGIAFGGNTAGTAVDSQGTNHTVKFTIPVATRIWVRVLYDLYSEEAFPVDGQAQIAAAVAAWAATEFIPGKDVIAPRMLGPAYTVPGIGNMVITASTDGSTYLTTISIDPGHVATVSAADFSFGTL